MPEVDQRKILQEKALIYHPFVFHNKVPKCGSSTMNRIVNVISQRNGFNYRFFNWDEQQKISGKGKEVTDPTLVLEIVEKELKSSFLLIGHHLWMDFQKLDMKPVYINVIRHPIDYVTSNFYF